MVGTPPPLSEETREALRSHLDSALDEAADDDVRYHVRQALQLVEIAEQ